MCLISSLYEARQQKKAAKEAAQRAANASRTASIQSQNEKNASAAQQAKEATTIDAGIATDEASAAIAKKSQGISSTQLNNTLG